MTKRKVYVVGNAVSYASWLPDFELCHTMPVADLIMFTGGADISPSLYKENRGTWTQNSMTRDAEEVKEYNQAILLEKPMIGICRGAQLLTALSGGRLIQDQEDPGKHPIYTWDGEEVMMSSLHHQAMYPYDMDEDDYKLIAWAEGHSKHHYDGNNQEISDKPFKEAEIVYYPKTRSLCIQGHPEMMSPNFYPATFELLYDLVERLLNKTL